MAAPNAPDTGNCAAASSWLSRRWSHRDDSTTGRPLKRVSKNEGFFLPAPILRRSALSRIMNALIVSTPRTHAGWKMDQGSRDARLWCALIPLGACGKVSARTLHDESRICGLIHRCDPAYGSPDGFVQGIVHDGCRGRSARPAMKKFGTCGPFGNTCHAIIYI